MAVDRDSADQLQHIIETQQMLTTIHEQAVQSHVAKYSAMRESERDVLKSVIGWPRDRDYIVDPLPEKIAEAFADLLFGEDPDITAAEDAQAAEQQEQTPAPGSKETSSTAEAPESSELGTDETPPPDVDAEDKKEDDTDQDRLDAIIEANDLPSELRHAETLCSSEGEVWWRVYRDLAQSDYPIIEWHSRSHVRPLFRGRRLVAACFFSDIWEETVEKQTIVWRYVEIQAEDYVRNLLYRGTPQSLGTKVALTDRWETQELKDEWEHSLGMMCGRILNKLGRDRRYGRSDFQSVEDLIFSLNEATTIAHENARLTGKKRAVVPSSALKEDGKFDAGEDILIGDDAGLDEDLDKTINAKFTVLEYTFDAGALIAHKTDIAGIILTRVGIAQQFVNPTGKGNMGAEGMAASGTALRLRLIPTTLAAEGKARFWDDALPKMLMVCQLFDALPDTQDGFGRKWNLPGEPPVVERSTPLPEDESEQISRHAQAVTAEIESRKTAIQDLHPDWSPEQVQTEMDQIDKEAKEFAPIKKPGPGQDGPPTAELPSMDGGDPALAGSQSGPLANPQGE